MDMISVWALALSGLAAVSALAALGVVAWRAAMSDPWCLPFSERFPLGPEGIDAPTPYKISENGFEPVSPQVDPDHITRAEASVMITEAVNAAVRQSRADLAQRQARDHRRMRG